MSNSTIALLLLDARATEALDKAVALDHFEKLMTKESLYDENWLLAYEANLKGWLPSLEIGDHVDRDPIYAHFKKQRITFYHSFEEERLMEEWWHSVSEDYA